MMMMEDRLSGSKQLLTLTVLVLSLIQGTESFFWRPPKVYTKYGTIIGKKSGWTQKFLGIPYAARPERWQDPVDAPKWKNPLKAFYLKPACPQRLCTNSFPDVACNSEMDENCLYLNIYSPRYAHWWSSRPVMIYIHGGSFTRGTGSAKFYNGAALAKKGVIVVTFNYRLGALGFMVTGSTSNDITGNYGLKDQRMAIKWVHDNIHKFGGNPNKITLFGQSAGALSVTVHLTSGKVDDLYRAAIIQSPPLGIPLTPQHIAAAQGAGIAKLLGCDTSGIDIACLKDKSTTEILDAQMAYDNTPFPDSALRHSVRWFPSIDNDEVKLGNYPMDSIPSGKFASKPIIIGSTTEEGQYFVPWAFPEPRPLKFLEGYLRGLFSQRADELLAAYSPADPNDVRPELTEINTDFSFTCPGLFIARKILSESTPPPVYTYLFNATVVDEFWNKLFYCKGRVCHNVDLPYIFPPVYAKDFTPSQLKLTKKIIRYWTNFVKYLNPNKRWYESNLLRWPKYDNQKRTSMLFDLTQLTSLTSKVKDDVCKIWDKGPYRAK